MLLCGCSLAGDQGPAPCVFAVWYVADATYATVYAVAEPTFENMCQRVCWSCKK